MFSISSEMVDFIDKGKNRDASVLTDAEQLFRLRFDALCHVDEHDGAVSCHKGTVRVFAEVLMARRVEYVDMMTFVIKLQDRTGDGNAALLFDFHPVGHGVFSRFSCFDRPG